MGIWKSCGIYRQTVRKDITLKKKGNILELLKKQILELSQSYGLISLKGGTEWEDMNYDEIAFLNSLGVPKIPSTIKIAGAEARVDIRNLKEIGVGVILGPMIESSYALEKFVTTVSEIYKTSKQQPTLAINIETINAVKNIDSIVTNSYFKEIDMVVIGRLDLSLSAGETNVDHPKVTDLTNQIIDKVQEHGKNVSIGGFVNPKSAKIIQSTMNANRINTLHALIDINKTPDISKSVELAIQFEIAFYEAMKKITPQRITFYDHRIAISKKKLV
ncbi:HpcH/HpaI aldolase/citrate lyase domain protein [Candidatus Magnetomorum sp. HK-1]|nr:HpcH/HpaI aldolase/citrate lyase domain protein [Candidatus Magnetomorum sp. HK-1]